MRQVIHITESDMKRIVAEAIKEIGDTPKGQYALGAVSGRTVGKRNYHNLGAGEKAEGDSIRNRAEDEAWENRRESSDEKMRNARNQGYIYGFEKGRGLNETLLGQTTGDGTASEGDSCIMAYREAIETAYNNARKADECVDAIGNPYNQKVLHSNIRKALEYLKFATQYYGETMGE